MSKQCLLDDHFITDKEIEESIKSISKEELERERKIYREIAKELGITLNNDEMN